MQFQAVHEVIFDPNSGDGHTKDYPKDVLKLKFEVIDAALVTSESKDQAFNCRAAGKAAFRISDVMLHYKSRQEELDQRLTELAKIITIGNSSDGRKQVIVNGVLYAQEYQGKGIRLWNDGSTAGLRIALNQHSKDIKLMQQQEGDILQMIGHQPIGKGHYHLEIPQGKNVAFINFYDSLLWNYPVLGPPKQPDTNE